jgi:Flp pilus assembly protein TadD
MSFLNLRIFVLCLVAFLTTSKALAAESTPSTFEGHEILAGKRAAAAEDWKAAIAAFTQAVGKEPNSADAYNYLAFSYRKSGDLDNAFKHYKEALRLDPKHRGAHEYIGEAYLTAGNLAKAEDHLKILDDICTFGCSEYNDLKKAVAEFKAKQK